MSLAGEIAVSLENNSVLPKSAQSSQTVETSHSFFNVSYTWYKSLFMPQVGALNWHLKTLIVPKKVLRHVLLQHCAVSISAMAPLMMKKTLLLYLHSTARDNCKFLFKKWGIFTACQIFYTRKTCSCLFLRYFCKLFWDNITIIWDENIVNFFDLKKDLFWTNKKFV